MSLASKILIGKSLVSTITILSCIKSQDTKDNHPFFLALFRSARKFGRLWIDIAKIT